MLLAAGMSLAALGIDLMLPAFGEIRAAFGLPPDSTAIAGLVTAYFLGLAGGQLLWGTLSDRFGRRPILLASFGVYALGALACTLAPSFTLLLAARLVWGLGASGPRAVTIAVVRDTFEGERMARAMSFIMAVFLVVPILAPALGAVLLQIGSWRIIFAFCVVAVVAVACWGLRLPETLHPEHRLPLRFGRVAKAARKVVTTRTTIACGLAMTALYGAFSSYLASSELIVGEVFGLDAQFPLIFGALAAVMGVGMLANARLVGRVGTRRLAHSALVAQVAAATAFVAVCLASDGRPPSAVFVVAMAALLGAQAMVIPNLNAIAMVPMGPIAGTAASVIGAIQIAGGAVVGAVIDRAFDGTVTPLAIGFVGCSATALAMVAWAERGRLFAGLLPPAPPDAPPIAVEA